MTDEATLIPEETIFDSTSIRYFDSHKTLQKQLASKDLRDGLLKWRLAFQLAYQDIKLRYRRSVLGPFWITISMAISVYSMGYLYSHLFHTDLQTYFPFLVGGMLSWTLLSTTITEMNEALVNADGMIKQIKLPYSIYIHRVAMRNIIIFFHNIVVIIPILIIFHHSAHVNFNTLMLIPFLAIFYLNAFCYGIILAIIGARYRDVMQIIKSLIQIAFFITPIMWNPNILPEKDRYIAYLNPFYSYVELIRDPLLGAPITLLNLGIVAGLTLLGITLSLSLFAKYRTRIVYWL